MNTETAMQKAERLERELGETRAKLSALTAEYDRTLDEITTARLKARKE